MKKAVRQAGPQSWPTRGGTNADLRAKGGLICRDAGGAAPDIGGVTPSASAMNPMEQNYVRSFTQMDPEKLQETVARLGEGSPAGSVAARVLRQKQMMPTPSQAAATGVSGMGADAGQGLPAAQHLDSGGVPNSMAYYMMQQRGSPSSSQGYGLLQSPTGAAGGRTDTLPHSVAANSYVIPADVVSGLGEGDTYSGAKVIDAMLHSMPYGIQKAQGGSRSHPPPAPPRAASPESTGGKAHGTPNQKVPVIVANGEYLIHPDDVARIGDGNHKRGHAVLDAFVKHVRNKTVKTLKKLPPPVK